MNLLPLEIKVKIVENSNCENFNELINLILKINDYLYSKDIFKKVNYSNYYHPLEIFTISNY